MEQLSGLDAFFLYLETPEMHMHVALSAVLDPSERPGGYSFEAIRDHIADRVHRIPPFHRRVVEVPLQLHHPVWVEDPDFNVLNHVKHVALPAPGGPEELGDLTGQIASTPLDRRRPLWEIWVVEGLHDGNIALVAKVHHCALDGVAGAELFATFFDLERDPTPAEPPEPVEPEPIPTDAELLTYAAISKVRTGLDLIPLVQKTYRSVTALRDSRQQPGHESGGTPLTAPRTHFNGAITSERKVAFAQVTLRDVKAVKNAFGVTVNDVILGICAGALRRYLEGGHELPDTPLVTACPVSVRTEDEQGEHGNRLSAMMTTLPTELVDPAERLREIHRVTAAAKAEHEVLGTSILGEWAEVAEPNLFNLASSVYSRRKLADKHPPLYNLAISSVPGPPFPVFLAGAELVRAYPMGPVTEGAGLNITAMTYLDNVDFGFMVCRDLVPDVWRLAEAVEPAFDELEKAAAELG